jgi:hypothetical protein
MKLTDLRNVSAGRFYNHGESGGHHHYTAEEMHNDDVAHEGSDVNLSAIIWSGIVLTVVCVFTAVLMYGFFWWYLIPQAAARDPKLSPLALPATVMPPTTTASPEFGSAPEPRLLTSEPTKLRQFREGEREQLHGYGWVDEKAGIARIPINRAKELVLEKGLPVRPDPLDDPRLGTHAPAFGEASSGRTITQPVTETPGAAAPAPAAPASAQEPAHKGGN